MEYSTVFLSPQNSGVKFTKIWTIDWDKKLALYVYIYEHKTDQAQQ